MHHAPALIPALIVLSLFLISGLLALGAALGNWGWFFNSRTAGYSPRGSPAGKPVGSTVYWGHSSC